MSIIPDRLIELSPPQPIQRGIAGGLRRDERRRDRDDIELSAKMRSALRERRLGALLERAMISHAIVLHDRHLPEGIGIDHVLIAPAGVWIVEARHESGQVTATSHTDHRIWSSIQTTTGRRDEIQLDLTCAAALTASALDCIGYDWVPVRTVTCFTNASLTRSARSSSESACTPKSLVTRVLAAGPLTGGDRQTIAATLSVRLPTVTH